MSPVDRGLQYADCSLHFCRGPRLPSTRDTCAKGAYNMLTVPSTSAEDQDYPPPETRAQKGLTIC